MAPGYPHHITQRGNRSQQTFFSDDDYRTYLDLLNEWCRRCSVKLWVYCLMPNHVHLKAAPECEDGLRRSIGEAHRRYTLRVNSREGWTGHLWQGRFASVVLDETHLLAAVRYVELKPVRAGLVATAEEWPWSSTRSHLSGREDPLVEVAPMRELVGNWAEYLAGQEDEAFAEALRRHERTRRVLGSEEYVEALESTLARPLKPDKRGSKSK